MTTGFHSAFVAAVIVAGLGIAVALTLIRRDDLDQRGYQMPGNNRRCVAA
jgi:hypothetical protein